MARLGASARHLVTFAPIQMVILMAWGSQAFEEIDKQKNRTIQMAGNPNSPDIHPYFCPNPHFHPFPDSPPAA